VHSVRNKVTKKNRLYCRWIGPKWSKL